MKRDHSIADGFSTRERLVVICLYCEELTVAETAAAVGLSEDQVRRINANVQDRVRAKLRIRSRPPK